MVTGPEPPTADFRFVGMQGVVPVVTTTEGRSVRLWGLAEQSTDKPHPSFAALEEWLHDGVPA